MRLKDIVVYLVALLILSGCFKDVSYNTTLFITPSQQVASGDDFTHLNGVLIYAFDADTTDFTPVDYNDALIGLLTNKTTGVNRSYFSKGVDAMRYYSYEYEIDDDDDEEDHPYADGETVVALLEGVELEVDREEIMLVAVDTENQMYAYTNYTVGVNIDIVYMDIGFRPWKTSSFTQGTWQFVVP